MLLHLFLHFYLHVMLLSTPSLFICVSGDLKWGCYSEHRYIDLSFLKSIQSLFVIWAFRPFVFKVLIDRNVLIFTLFMVLGCFSHSFFVPSFFFFSFPWHLSLWFGDYLSIMFVFLFLYVYIIGFWLWLPWGLYLAIYIII